ncbi:helix-turn-helix transcriptional regulator [Paenibacillus mendelii]|uniref:Helix-turn-helix transcriptional regulator n=1 Tax=Paenibacillus mendelii TaxID=206163 RepID=A0ABV6J1N6_9BACL|nr:AraC family transcriptional regulator [Paenibacillus mendelii]MCQ6563194.1 AraC family transcriptional regulator [Paenibacillus mendelii]
MNRLIASRGLLQIFFALLLVIIIMFVSNYVVYKNSISGIYEKVAQNNRLVIKNIIQSFNNSFTTVNNLIFTIHGLPYDNLFAQGDGSIDMAKVYSLQDNITTLASSADYIEDIIIFFDNHDLAITSKGTSNMSVLFDKKFKHDIYNTGYWKTFAKSKHPSTVFPADTFVSQGETMTKKSRQLMAIIDGNKVRMSDKNILVMINVEKLLNHVDMKAMLPGASLIVLDPTRKIILSTEKDWDLVEVLNDVYFNTSSEASLTHNNFEYNFYKSDYNGFVYIDKVPYQFKNIDSVTNASRMIMISAIICAVILSALLSVFLYRPVKGILKLLGGGSIKGNDFRKIHSGIVKVQSENEALKKQMNFVDLEIRRGVFLQTLDAYNHSQEYEIQMQKYYPYFFRERQFVMAAVHLKGLHPDKEQTDLSIEEMTEAIRAGLQQGAGHVVVFHSSQLQFLAMIGIGHSFERAAAIDRLEAFIQRAEKEELKGFVAWACVSKVYDSHMRNCHAAYQEIMNGMLYRNVNPSGSVLDTESIRFVADIHFPFEKIEKLSNCMLSGKTNEGMRIITDLIKENADRGIHHHQLAHVARSILSYMMKQIDGSPAVSKELYRLETEFLQRVDNAYGYKEVQDALLEAVQVVASKRNHDQKSKLNPAFISQYIDLHYMENLYLDHMAEVLDTSPKYFSNYFKKTFGVNYVEYLNKVRLSHAREQLKNSDLSIAEIGEKTGYMNSSTFTTTFKKYYGISPSEYRKHPGD